MFGFIDFNFIFEIVCILCSYFSLLIFHLNRLLAVFKTGYVWCCVTLYIKLISYQKCRSIHLYHFCEDFLLEY